MKVIKYNSKEIKTEKINTRKNQLRRLKGLRHSKVSVYNT